ncbi:hypothetical protein [Streptomyces sp. NBC_00576]|uniref:hypothetical protein n=1 Tax=Streptomyces sp. NBC_00576 TaxID=2903665 RepID=UPI002E804528|nr:hypothetical protein [Streptomyces sp. NBC_00576]WUB75431.1 hypothetical protein OG734_38205 [Streptomyces sp. NBC_00576]
MRLPRSFAPLLVAVALITTVPYEAVPHTRVEARQPERPEPFGSTCHTRVTGSKVTAYCHNPYVPADRVRLHIECDRWWDLDSDGSSVEAGPAQTVRLTGRCWKEVRSVWVSHQKRTP